MEIFNLGEFVKFHGLEPSWLAKALFPKNKYPKLAYHRVVRGRSHLDTRQLKILADFASVDIGDLFNRKNWNSKKQGDHWIFEKPGFRAVMDSETMLTKIYSSDTGELLGQMICARTILLCEYVKSLNTNIKQFQK